MTLEEARRQAKELFADIGTPTDCELVEVGRREAEGKHLVEHIKAMTPPGFPIPGLLLFGLTQLLGLETYGPEEKMRWGVCFAFRGSTFGFELRKFGLRALCQPNMLDTPTLKEVLGRARALTNIVETYLSGSGYVANQINSGRFTIVNLYGQLDARYRFLREKARAAYATPPPPPERRTGKVGTFTTFDPGRPEREGSALGTAAVDAYFSLQEHLFCISLAFTTFGQSRPDLLQFLGANWRTKARLVLNIRDPAVKAFYDRLVAIREEWRNPLAHGGFLSGGGSLYFHLPGIGALPARLRRTSAGVKVRFSLRSSSFTEIMGLFDSFDAFLLEGPLRYPIKWGLSGLDVAFDAHSAAAHAAAMQSDETFEEFIEYRSYEEDLHTNMDY